MKIPTIKYAFYGCSLENGTKFISLFHVFITSVLFLLNFIDFFVPILSTEVDMEDNLFANETDLLLLEYGFYVEGMKNSYFLMNTVLIGLIISCYFLYGVMKAKIEYIFPWILLVAAFASHSMMIVILNLIFSIQHNPSDSLLFILGEIACSGVELYCALVVYSYVRMLLKDEDGDT